MSKEERAKIEFRVVGEDGTVDVETLWAVLVRDGVYRLENCPFYAYGVSLGDLVKAERGDGEGFPVFCGIAEKSGHRTVRVIIDPPPDRSLESQKILEKLSELGCSHESMTPSYFVVDIPPNVSLDAVREFLVKSGVQWEHADPTYAELIGDESQGG